MEAVKCKCCGKIYAYITDKDIAEFCILCKFKRLKNIKKSDEFEQLTLF